MKYFIYKENVFDFTTILSGKVIIMWSFYYSSGLRSEALSRIQKGLLAVSNKIYKQSTLLLPAKKETILLFSFGR